MAVGRTLPVSESIWLDIKFRKLKNWERYLFIYFLTNNHVEQVGVYELSYDTIHYETDLEIVKVKEGIENIKKLGLVDYDEETNEIAILNYLKYSILKGGDPTMKCFMNLGKKIKSTKLMEEVYKKMVDFGDDRTISLFAQLMLKNTLHYRKTNIVIEIPESLNPYVRKEKSEKLSENVKKELIQKLLNKNYNKTEDKGIKKNEKELNNVVGDEELVIWSKPHSFNYCYVKIEDIKDIEYTIIDVQDPSGKTTYYKCFKNDQLENITTRIIQTFT